MVEGLCILNPQNDMEFCESCPMGKNHRVFFQSMNLSEDHLSLMSSRSQ
jgi:hypothetical protein